MTPSDPYVLELKDHFEAWLATHPDVSNDFSFYSNDGLKNYSVYGDRLLELQNISWDALDQVEQSVVIDWYIRINIVQWTADSVVYSVQDYWATPHEIIQQIIDNNWTGPAHDDCDGIAAVTVSLMRDFNISAYLGLGIGHMYTVVQISNQDQANYRLDNSLIILNYWEQVHFWGYFDGSQYIWTQDPISTVEDMLVMGDTSGILTFSRFCNHIFMVNLSFDFSCSHDIGIIYRVSP